MFPYSYTKPNKYRGVSIDWGGRVTRFTTSRTFPSLKSRILNNMFLTWQNLIIHNISILLSATIIIRSNNKRDFYCYENRGEGKTGIRMSNLSIYMWFSIVPAVKINRRLLASLRDAVYLNNSKTLKLNKRSILFRNVNWCSDCTSNIGKSSWNLIVRSRFNQSL